MPNKEIFYTHFLSAYFIFTKHRQCIYQVAQKCIYATVVTMKIKYSIYQKRVRFLSHWTVQYMPPQPVTWLSQQTQLTP